MSKMSDFFKTKSGLAIKTVVMSAMAVNVANAASDVPTFDERTGYENLGIQSLVDMKEQKLALDEVIHEMNLRVAHCDLVAIKLGEALSGMNVIQASKGFTSLGKLVIIGKIADSVLNDPVNFRDFGAPLEDGLETAGVNEEPASAPALLIGDILDQETYVEVQPEDLKSSAAEVLDRTTSLIGVLQEDLDVCVEAVSSMMHGYNNIRTTDLNVDNPERVLAINLGYVSQAYEEYSAYIEHSYMEDHADMSERMAHEEERAKGIETSDGMNL
ncbi:hypothetical protein [Roseibium sp. RKSG952]|uniref:hypothetical protein n=1 Tax=Roseibium sp. RKSG952 TaxID=2529384 RepID=UPI0012BB73FB|nr:hypothetical protein [Roseibium sp. RKSG952]MTH95216.1 hypothetical protein [Roseibium sp. RKSG952]